MTIAEFLSARLAEDERMYVNLIADTFERIQIKRKALRDIEAKRAVLNMALTEEQAIERFAGFFIEEGAGWDKAQEYVLSHLAAVYNDHPGYRKEWTP